jgi:predicted phosphodiesterase
MLLAFLSDIHGNLPALKSALADAKRRGAYKIYCAGDLVGYGPFPDEVCKLLAEENIATITGNYDVKALAALHRPKDSKKGMKPGKWKILNWTRKHISSTSAKFLANLPDCRRETLFGRFRLLIVHGSPVSPEDTIYPSITRYSLEKKLSGEKTDIIVCGHTHIPFVKRFAGITVVNCGSAGQPIDGDPRPSYALINIDKKKPPSVAIIRFRYPYEELIRAIEDSSLPHGLASDFRNGDKKREPT